MGLFLLFVAVFLVIDALKGYHAANYASKQVYGKKTGFFDYMCQNHPVMIGIVLFIILASLMCFISDNPFILLLILIPIIIAAFLFLIKKSAHSKKWLVFVVSILSISLLSVFLFIVTRPNYQKMYVQAAQSVAEEYGITDATVTITENGMFEGYDVYLLVVESPIIDNLPIKNIFYLTKDIDNIIVSGWKNSLVQSAVRSNGNEYKIDYNGNLEKNGIDFYTYNAENNSNSISTSHSANCIYANCDDPTYDGSSYCVRHKCSVAGCGEKVIDPASVHYCSAHDKELNCAKPGCHARKYMDSDYCEMHYPDGK